MMQHVKRWATMRSWLLRGPLVGLALASLVALLPGGVSAYAQGLTPHARASSSGWTISKDGTGGAFNDFLYASATIASNDIWVAGQANADLLFEHWNGTKWTVVGSPNPGSYFNTVVAMSADSSTDIWAVGYYGNDNSGDSFLVVEHWNGVQWNNTSISLPSNVISAQLSAVTALSANDVWIAGTYDQNSNLAPFVENWNGSQWNMVAIPSLSNWYEITALKASQAQT